MSARGRVTVKSLYPDIDGQSGNATVTLGGELRGEVKASLSKEGLTMDDNFIGMTTLYARH